jgi:hypothetical protein
LTFNYWDFPGILIHSRQYIPCINSFDWKSKPKSWESQKSWPTLRLSGGPDHLSMLIPLGETVRPMARPAENLKVGQDFWDSQDFGLDFHSILVINVETNILPFKDFFVESCLCLWKLIRFHLIHSYEAGFYKSTSLKLYPLVYRNTGNSKMPG